MLLDRHSRTCVQMKTMNVSKDQQPRILIPATRQFMRKSDLVPPDWKDLLPMCHVDIEAEGFAPSKYLQKICRKGAEKPHEMPDEVVSDWKGFIEGLGRASRGPGPSADL
jgi:hypothetical protein